ncbi:hypothetical protein [Dietzia alimentaria]|uniref:hypothetical protein n=1 Tax=Dietzia alimentaria TaxID=665550 RepID=UPI00029A84B9|nr:hypothetical protein [Dietzia alimentaria]
MSNVPDPEMGWEALDKVRKVIPILADRDVDGYHALTSLVPFLSCWQYGHPSQPRARRKWANRPWRCERCGTWWVAEKADGNFESWWDWKRVEEGQ